MKRTTVRVTFEPERFDNEKLTYTPAVWLAEVVSGHFLDEIGIRGRGQSKASALTDLYGQLRWASRKRVDVQQPQQS